MANSKKNNAKKPMSMISNHEVWTNELELLFSILRATELVEETKWGGPCFTIDGKNVVGIGGFKSYVGLWFHQGVFLKDPKKLLLNASDGKTKALRQMRFKSMEEIDSKVVKAYIIEAIENAKLGKELKPEKKSSAKIPIELEEFFKKDNELLKKFEALTTFKQREYIDYIAEAKQEKTKITRVEKSIPLIKLGKGLNDKYR